MPLVRQVLSLDMHYSPSVLIMHQAKEWQKPTVGRAAQLIVPRFLCVTVVSAAILEATAHLAVASVLFAGSLARHVVVISLSLLSWSLAAAHVFAMKWALEVGYMNWVLRIVTEVGVLITRPITFLSQWKDRVRVIFWAITRDRWLWDLSKAVQKKFHTVLNFSRAFRHAKLAFTLLVAALAIPIIGIVNPTKAQRRFTALGIAPESRFHRLYRQYRLKALVVACAGVAIAVDYRRGGYANPAEYRDQWMSLANTHVVPKWNQVTEGAKWLRQVIYNQIFYERLDYAMQNRANRAQAELLEVLLKDHKNSKTTIQSIRQLFGGS